MYFQEKTEAGLQHNKVNYGWATPSTIHFDPMDRLKEPKPWVRDIVRKKKNIVQKKNKGKRIPIFLLRRDQKGKKKNSKWSKFGEHVVM